MDLPNKKYQIIYADPPWQYDFSKDNSDRIEEHYPTMLLEEIKNLNVPSDINCVLFLWATAPKLIEALEVIKAWGFQYKTHAIWDKKWIGMGYWFRGQHELLLVGVKGEIHPPKQTELISSIFREKRTEHSKKPAYIRTLISKWYPNASKIELFSRQRFEGWDVWGNEAPKDTQMLLKNNTSEIV